MMKISINMVYWKSNDPNRERNVLLSWQYLKRFREYIDLAEINVNTNRVKFVLDIKLFDFSHERVLEEAIHIPYPEFSFEKSKKINDVLNYYNDDFPDFVSIIDTDVIIPEPLYDEMIQYLNNLNKRNYYVFDLDDVHKDSYGIDFKNAVIDFSKISTSVRNMNPDLGALFFVSYKSLLKIGGFDERFTVWGAEDNDVAKRLNAIGLVKILTPYKMVHLYHKSLASDSIKSEQYKKQLDIFYNDKSVVRQNIRESNNESYRLVFIIAHKWFRGYESYVKYYIENILKFYKDPLILVVDNNSEHKNDIFDTLRGYKEVVLLDNNIDSKYEFGAYQVGFNYILDNNLSDKYQFFVCTQDTFMLKNKYDFNILLQKNIKACTINSFHQDGHFNDIVIEVLSRLNLYNNMDKVTFCWCSSFIIHNSVLQQMQNYLKQIKVTNRSESCAGERYMTRILYELNNNINYDIDGDQSTLNKRAYDCLSVDPYAPVNTYFLKRSQQKQNLK